ESLLLAAAGSALGLLGAVWVIEALRILAPEGMPRLDEIAVGPRVAGFAVALGIVTSLSFGLAPALRASRVDIAQTLRGARSGRRRDRRVRDSLVIAQIALATVLLVGAGLMMRSFLRLQSSDPGFEPASVVAVPLQL